MAALDDLASKLFGSKRAESSIVSTDATTRTYVGTATSASEDGSVYVALSQDVTLPDDDDGEHGIGVEMPTTVGVSEGDEVLVTLMGGGTMKSPVVTGNPGWGDSIQTQVDNAETLAQQAEAVATATGQHFWTDNDGVHVTEVTQEDWNDSTGTNYHSGANVLLNALGQLFRDGLNNILAIVSGTDPGIAIYDGSGNSAENILALLTKSLIRLGGRFAASGRSTAKVQFFEDNSALTDLTAEHYIDTTTEPQVSHDLALSSTVTDDELPDGTSRTVTGNVEVWEQIYNDGTDYSDEVYVSLNGMTTDRTNTVSMGIQAIQDSSGSWQRTAFAVADNLRLTHGTGSQVTTADVPMEQAIAVLSSPVTLFTGTYAQTHSAAVTLSESAANFSRLVFVCENNDGERTSVTVTDPNGKHFNVVMVTIAGPTGTGTYAYMKAKSFSINGTSVTCRTYTYNGQTIYRHGSVTLRNGVAVAATQASEEIGIVKVLGWR